MKHWHVSVVILLAIASALWSSGIIPAIVPAAVAPANKIGNSSKFQLGASGAVAGDCPTFDANLNITGPGTGSACGTSANAGGGLTVYSGTAGIALSGTTYFPIGGGSAASATETSVDADISASSTISRFGANLSTALGMSNSVVFTWRKNSTDQTLTCTISGAVSTSCADTVDSFAVVPGDLIDIKAVFSGTIVVTPVFIMTAQIGSLVQGQVNVGTAGNIGYYATSAATISGGNFTGDVSNSTLALTVNKVNGVAYAASPSTNTIPLITASNTATYSNQPDCQDTGGNHLNFTASTHLYNCGTSGGSTAVSYFIRQSGAASASTLAMGINVVSGNYLFVMTGTNTAYPTIADTLSSTFTAITNATSAGGNFGKMWVALLASSGADTITLTGGSSQNVAAIEMVPPAGFAGTVDNFASNIVAGGPVSITVSQANDFLVCATAWDHGSVIPMSLAPCNVAAHANSSDGITIGYSVLPLANTTVWVGFSASSGNSGDGITIAASLK